MEHAIERDQLPAGFSKKVTGDVLKKINNMIEDSDVKEEFRDSIIGFSHILQNGNYKLESYLNACKYAVFKSMGDSNTEAYMKTFPERMQRMQDDGKSNVHISKIVNLYSKTQLVNKILEQTLIPAYIYNADIHQESINVLANLMRTANSEKVRCESASKLIDALKLPETTKIQLDVGMKEDSAIADLRRTTIELAKTQKELIESGVMSAKQAAHLPVIQGEVIERVDSE